MTSADVSATRAANADGVPSNSSGVVPGADGASASSSVGVKQTSFRRDVQGLRAIAVTLVMADHIVGWPTGGFIGVDVFFVISGYLITGLLLREHQSTGSISLRRFYQRRVRRLLPAAILVIVIAALASSACFFGSRSRVVLLDALASLTFVQNWHLVRNGTDYLGSDAVLSPLQHFWSLAVEEQFYAVWPWLIVVGFAVAARRAKTSSRALGMMAVLIGVVAMGSFGWALVESASRPTWAYFSTASRAWELAVGALVAIAEFGRLVVPPRLRAWFLCAALSVIGASAFVIGPGWEFPGPWALPPVLATAAAIAAGIGAGSTYRPPLLGSRWAVFVGDASYSLYLWHFPVAVFAAALIPQVIARSIVATVVTVVLATASYHLVEHRLRRVAKPLATRSRRSEITAGSIALIAVMAMTAFQMLGPATLTTGASTIASRVVTPISNQSDLSTGISAALNASDWPPLQPSLDDLPAATAFAQSAGCLINPRNSSESVERAVMDKCAWGPVDGRRALVVGDSIAAAWLPGVVEALTVKQWRVSAVMMSACPIPDVSVNEKSRNSAFPAACNAARKRILSAVSEAEPDLIVVSGTSRALGSLVDGATGAAAAREWETGTARSIAALSTSGADVVVLDAPPDTDSVQECATRLSGPQSCIGSVSDQYRARSAAERRAVAARAAAGDPVRFVEVADWFCDGSGRCPAFIDGSLVRADGVHITDEFSRRLTPVIAASLVDGLTARSHP